MKAALYLRRSTTDLQPDSLEAQDELLTKYAADNGHEIVRRFADSASGRSLEGRDQFKAMIEDVKAGADYEVILVRDVARWSRADNLDEAGFYEFICRSHGVEVLFVAESFGPDSSPYSVLFKSIKRAMAAEFARNLARTVQASQSRLVRQGFWTSGAVPYGLKRTLVDENGGYIQDLLPGDRKSLSNQRVRLALGNPDHVAVVRQIFVSYGEDRQTLNTIAATLNDTGIRTSKGSLWNPCGLAHVIRNEAYAGTVVYCLRNGDKKSDLRNSLEPGDDRIARCEGAHEAIMPPTLWAKANARLKEESWRKTDADLLAELHDCRGRWHQRVKQETVTPSQLRHGYAEPEEQIIRGELKKAQDALRTDLERELLIDDFEDGWLLDHLLHVGFRVSLPHAKLGGLQWQFSFVGTEPFDVVVGFAFSPPPVVQHVETFLFRSSHIRHRDHLILPRVNTTLRTSRYSRYAISESLLEPLTHAFHFRGRRAEALMLAALRDIDKVNLSDLAERLGWPLTSTTTLYRKLELRGEAVPPLKNGRSGKKVTVTCPHCFRDRVLSVKTVLTLKTDVCFDCIHRPPVRTPLTRVTINCPRCSKPRSLPPSDLQKLSKGPSTLCVECSRADGRKIGAELQRQKAARP